jgi:hypothetical protein
VPTNWSSRLVTNWSTVLLVDGQWDFLPCGWADERLTGQAYARSNCLQPSQTHQLVKLPPQPITNWSSICTPTLDCRKTSASYFAAKGLSTSLIKSGLDSHIFILRRSLMISLKPGESILLRSLVSSRPHQRRPFQRAPLRRRLLKHRRLQRRPHQCRPPSV